MNIFQIHPNGFRLFLFSLPHYQAEYLSLSTRVFETRTATGSELFSRVPAREMFSSGCRPSLVKLPTRVPAAVARGAEPTNSDELEISRKSFSSTA